MIVLMITMIVGVITVVATLVTRMPDGRAMAPVLPDGLMLPAGQNPVAVTMGQGWIGVVTDADHFVIFDNAGTMLQDIPVTLP